MCVIVNHAIIKTDPMNFYNSMFYKVNWSFHMPIFFIVSGYFIYMSTKDKGSIKWLRDKARRFLIPHFSYNIGIFFWSVTGLAFYDGVTQQGFGKWMLDTSVFDGGEWFLWTLFGTYALMMLILHIDKRNKDFLFYAFALVIVVVCIPINHGGFLRLAYIQYFFPYVLCGYLIAKYRNEIQEKILNKITKKHVIVIFSVLLTLYVLLRTNFDGAWTTRPYLDMFYSGGLHSVYYTLALLSIPLVYLTIKGISKISQRFNYVLSWVGRHSLVIYISSLFFPGLYFGVGHMAVITSALFSFLMALVISFIVDNRKRIFNYVRCRLVIG